MKYFLYIPPSIKAAEMHLSSAFGKGLGNLNKTEFLRGWCSLFYLYPGLHPDGFDHPDSGWLDELKPYAVEAWRRYGAGEISDDEFYCYRSPRARIRRELEALMRMA